MSANVSSVPSGARRFAIVGALALSLFMPSVALAANTATFSAATPKPGSTSQATTPRVRISVYDKNGVKGASNYSMTIDGVRVTPRIAYAGTKSRPDLRRFTLTRQTTSALAAGWHTVVVKVHDRKGKNSTYSWRFGVEKPVPVYVQMPSAGSACADCHAGFPATHPMTDCVACHNPAAPPRPEGSVYGAGYPMASYTAASTSPHTLGCMLSVPCHGGGGLFPHKLDSDCTRCHNRAYPTLPQLHTTDPVALLAAHESTSTFCTNPYCHSSSLTAEHYRYTIGGLRFSCVTCHGSPDPLVTAAIASGSTACASCHGTAAFTHPNTATSHAVTGQGLVSCVRAGCHASDLAPVHGGRCDFCHSPSAPLAVRNAVSAGSTDCTTCHGTVSHTSKHDLPQPRTDTCSGSGCHDGTNLTTLQIGTVPAARHQVCATCHDPSAPQSARDAIAAHDTSCIACHGSGLPAGHGAHLSTATAAVISINGHSYGSMACAACHGNAGPDKSAVDLQKIPQHVSCATCHPAPAGSARRNDFTCDQASCHGGGTLTRSALVQHAGIGAAHDTTTGVSANCGGSGCHDVSDVAVIHNALGRADHGCGICHDGTIVATPTKSCSAAPGCHPTYPVKLPNHTSHVATVTAAVITINGRDYGSIACAICHGNAGPGNARIDVQKIPQHTSCAACHPTPAGSAGRTDFTCAQSSCHGSGTLRGTAALQHAAVSSAHDTSPSVTTNCGGAGCHGLVTDVALIHDSVPGRTDRGCGICHDGTIVAAPTRSCSAAAGCHPTYPTAPSAHASHPSTLTAAVITINAVSYGSHACTECHASMELQAAHGGTGSCVKCHPSPANTVAKGSFACAQGGCHVTAAGNMSAFHGSVSASHTLGASPTCIAAGCHTGGTDVAAIHGVAGGPGCAACHGAGKTPSLACVTCHPTYPTASTDHASHLSTVTAAVMTINSVSYGSHSCSECHSPLELQSLHGGASSCVKCHPSPASTVTSGTFACSQAGCHVTAAGNMQAQHASISASHTLGAVPSCIAAGCHTGGTDVAAIHGVAGGPGCAACHRGGKVPSLVCVTCHPTYPAASTDHASHVSTVTAAVISINSVSYGSHLCSECHSPLELQSLHGGASSCVKCHPSPASTVTSGTFACAQAGCHVTASGNMRVQHASISASHTLLVAPSCAAAGCHPGGNDVAAIHGAAGGPGCGACHGAGKTPSLACVTCHPTYPTADPAHASHPSTVTAAVISINSVSYGSHSCSECHAPLELQSLHGGASSCVKCHPSPASTAGKLNFTCQQGGCHVTAAGNMLAQHASLNASHTVGATPSCIGSGCHTGGTDVAAIHAVAGGPGCGACHGAGKTPSLVCVTCHPTYPSPDVLHASHTSTVTAAVISINSTSYGSHSCSECHSPLELQSLHGGASSCVKCHPSPASTAGKLNFTCQQGGCHVTAAGNMLAQHASLNASHTVGATPSCIGSGCHTGGTDVAAIHAVAGGPGCGACHGAGKTPSLVCVTCHPTYPAGSTSHTSHVATVTVGTITINGAAYPSHSCTECHATMDLQQIAKHPACATCHPTPSSVLPKNYFACAQAGCHSGTTTLSAIVQHGRADASHTVNVSGNSASCVQPSCHAGSVAGGKLDLAAVHNVPKLHTVTPDKCAICHNTTTKPPSACATAGCHGPSDSYPLSAYSSTSSVVPHVNEVAKHNAPVGVSCNSGSYCHGECMNSGCHPACGTLPDYQQLQGGDLPSYHAVGAQILGDTGGATLTGCTTCHTPGQSGTKDCWSATCHDRNAMNMP